MFRRILKMLGAMGAGAGASLYSDYPFGPPYYYTSGGGGLGQPAPG